MKTKKEYVQKLNDKLYKFSCWFWGLEWNNPKENYYNPKRRSSYED